MIKKILLYTANLFLYHISRLVIKNNDVWVFGAWFGQKYSDNSRALFEYCFEYKKEIKVVWVSENPLVVDCLRKEGYQAYSTYSFLGYYYCMIAKVGVVVTGKSDINRYVVNSKMNLINLYHGIPLKKIMYDDKITFSSKPNLLSKIFPFLKKTVYKYITSSSIEVKSKMSSAFRINEDNVIITGNPRNDLLINNIKLDYNPKFKIGIYLPTHRGEGKGGEEFFNHMIEDFISIDSVLTEMKIKLYVKLHFYHFNEVSKLKFDFNSIEFIQEEIELYSFLAKMDFLITDYSSVYFDYLLLDRPIIFYPFDLEDYLKHDREFYYDYNEVTPGDKSYSSKDLIESIKKLERNNKDYSVQRRIINDKFNAYRNNNSERVFEFLRANTSK